MNSYTLNDLQRLCRKHKADLTLASKVKNSEEQIDVNHETCSCSYFNEGTDLEDFVEYVYMEFMGKLQEAGLEKEE